MSKSRKEEIVAMLQSEPNDSFLRYALACEQEKEGDLEGSVGTLKALRNDDPDYYGLYYKLGQILENIDQPEAAEEAYNAGIKVCERLGQQKIKNELEQALWLLD